MPDHWELLEATPAERDRFDRLAAVLALPGEPAAPPNRLRHVLRLPTEDGPCFLKVFRRTQPKNRLRFVCTRPRARSDAEREARVTAALRARGVHTPRPIAVGHRGRRSYYLCAELGGRPLAELLAARGCPPETARAAAAFCGRILASGFTLPDLSADHVHVGTDGADGFGVLDLHNGTLRRPGRPLGRRAAARILRHFGRSVRGMRIPRAQALAFAVRLLRAAGCGARARAVLRRVPPLDPHHRYESAARAAAYAGRSAARTRRELELLRRVWPGRPGDLVLDAPCGVGRLTPLLHDLGARPLASDRSRAMLAGMTTTGQIVPDTPPALQADNRALPLSDRSVDGVVLFRFLHHLPPNGAGDTLAEAARVARRFVVASFFHPISVHGLRRRSVELLRGRARTRHAVTLGWLRRRMAALGFRLHRCAAQRRYLREFWVAGFVRGPAG